MTNITNSNSLSPHPIVYGSYFFSAVSFLHILSVNILKTTLPYRSTTCVRSCSCLNVHGPYQSTLAPPIGCLGLGDIFLPRLLKRFQINDHISICFQRNFLETSSKILRFLSDQGRNRFLIGCCVSLCIE
jgi:hypothetical protein